MAAEKKLSLEEAGREARRTAFEKLAGEYGKPQGGSGGKKVQIALAHHENDNAETVLHNLIRGTGAAGLGGIRPVWDTDTEQGSLWYIRPLLEVSRNEIEEFLRAQQITWMTDSTNLETEYTRNKLRHQVIPVLESMNPAAVQHIGHTAGTMLQIEEYLQSQAHILYKAHVEPEKNGYGIRKELFGEKELMQSYVVREVLSRAAGGRKNLTSTHIQEVLDLAKGRTGTSLSLPGGLLAVRSTEMFISFMGTRGKKRSVKWNFRYCPGKRGK